MSFTPYYTISDRLLNLVAQAEAAKQIIENSLIVPYWERKFKNEALIRTVHHSTAIEGNKLLYDDTAKIIRGEELDTFRLRDVREIVNYRDVIGFISANKDKHLTTGLINSVHKILGQKLLSQNYLGKFRKQKAVIINYSNGEIMFDPSHPQIIAGEIDELVSWDQATHQLHPIIKAGIIHFELVRIHPFVDLNGRTARAITTWSLYRDGFDIKRFFSLEEYYDQDLLGYYNALDSAHDGDFSSWIEYFSLGISQELERIKKLVLNLSHERKLILKFGQLALNERQIELVSYLEEHAELRNVDFINIFPLISDDTILRDLNDLINKGIISKKGKTKAARYILNR